MSTNDDEPVEGELVPDPGEAPSADPLAGLLGGGADGPGAGLDLGAMMEMAANVQQQVAEAQERLVEARIVGSAGAGMVTVTLNGHLHLLELHIDPHAADPEDPTMLEDLVRAAWQDAHDQVAQLQSQADPLGGMGGAGGLGGLLGGA